MAKASRKEVYSVIDGERDYQDAQRGNAKRHEGVTGPVQVGAFVVYMEKCLNDAREAVYRGETGAVDSLQFIRKVTALGVACMEEYGAPPRL